MYFITAVKVPTCNVPESYPRQINLTYDSLAFEMNHN